MSATERQRGQLITAITPLVEQLGYELDDVAVTRVGRRSLVRVTVDGESGVDLDAIAELSRTINAALDADDPFDTPFVLEVSSPGIDRPLTEPRHWRRNVGRLVTTSAVGEEITARIEGVTEQGALLKSDDRSDDPARLVAWTDLGAGRIQIEFGRRSTPSTPKEK